MIENGSDIYVFGSNRAGRHGAGSALTARVRYGAIYGQGEGLQGHSYGIPTKDEQLRTLTLTEIEAHVKIFLDFARSHPLLTFYVVPIGCGLAGYKPHQIAPMFRERLNNVQLPSVFLEELDR